MGISLFNSSNSGDVNTTLIRELTTSLATVNTGTLNITISAEDLVSPSIQSEGIPIKGIVLNIHSIDFSIDSILKISIDALDGSTHSFNYPVTALAGGKYTGDTTHNISQYWQIFNFNDDVIIPTQEEFKIRVGVNRPLALSLVSTLTDFNRYILVDELSVLFPLANLSKKVYPNLYICGHLFPDSQEAVPIITKFNTGAFVDTITICNKGTLWFTDGGAAVINKNVIVTSGGTLSASGSCEIVLEEAAGISGLDRSIIALSGNYKLPYSYVLENINTSTNSLSFVHSVDTWNINDTLFISDYGTYTSTPVAKSVKLQTKNNTDIIIEPAISSTVYSLTGYNLISEFKGTPVCNVTKDIKIAGMGLFSPFIVEDTCNLSLKNVSITDTQHKTASLNNGIITLKNRNTVIENCFLSAQNFSRPYGVAIDGNFNTNVIVKNSVIYNGKEAYTDPFLRTGIYVNNKFKSPSTCALYDNIIIEGATGIEAFDTTNLSVSGNVAIRCAQGYYLNVASSSERTIPIFNKNLSHSCDTGININNTIGSVTNNIFVKNTIGINQLHTVLSAQVSANGVTCLNNVLGYLITSHLPKSTNVNLKNINVQNSSQSGIIFNNIYGTVLGLSCINNTDGIYVNNCFNGIFSIDSIIIQNTNTNLHFSYPANNNCNFFPVYVSNGTIGNAAATNCIILDQTNCEKFVAENIIFKSSQENIKLITSSNRLIEGSYIFHNCTFDNTPFSDISTNYQSTVFAETGFVSMYENNNEKTFKRFLAAGIVESDFSVYRNDTYKISEKLTPTSSTIPIKSGIKAIPVDSAGNTVPFVPKDKELYVSVWVKKTENWASNPPPVLIMKSAPYFGIYQDKIIATHSTNSTEWVQLSSIQPIVLVPENKYYVVEVYVECVGA